MRKIAILLCLFALFGCENEARRNKKLRKKLEDLVHHCKVLQQNIERVKKEQQLNWHRSAKERQAFLYDFYKNSGTKLKYERDIVSVQFRRKKVREFKVTVKIKPRYKTIKPHFLIQVYNRNGLIIGSCYQKKKFWGGKIAKGQSQERHYTLKLLTSEKPVYFRIAYPE